MVIAMISIHDINEPPQNDFLGGPGGIAFAELLCGRRRIVVLGVLVVNGTEQFINCMQEYLLDFLEACRVALANPNEIVNKDIKLG